MPPSCFISRQSLALATACGVLLACSGGAGSDDAGGEAAGRGALGAGGSGHAGATGQGGSAAGGGAPATGGAGSGQAGLAGSGGSRAGASGSAGLEAGSSNGGEPSGGRSSSGGAAPGGAGAGAGGRENGGTSGGGAGAGGTSGGGAGLGGSGGAAVDLPDGVTGLFPPPNATGVCPDPQLRITFPAPPKLGTAGTIEVRTSSGTVAASINLASSTVTDTIGGQSFKLERRAYVDGNTAILYLPSKGLAYGGTYSVTVPKGAIVPSGGGSFSLSGDAWSFSTAGAKPASLASVRVALDGSGAFCSLQGALDALPANNTNASTITLAAGKYHEVVYFKSKSNVTVHGESRSDTVILGTNNNDMNGSTKTRALVGADSSQGLVFENLTIQNLTPQGGSQAEALRLEGCTHCTIRDADILSLQDTLLWSGTLYAKNCFIAGNVDFVWGTGAAYFDQCEIKTVGRSGYVVQARNAPSGYGYVFVDSKITADPGITGSVLARIDVSAYPGSHVAYINCAMGSHISSAGWLVTGGSPTSSLRFWEYQSTDLNGKPLDVSGRAAGSTQISASQASTMRDPAAVLGGWNPG